MQNDHPIEDVMARARRGKLSSDEQRRLQLAVGSSIENRLLFEAGFGFASDGQQCLDDDLLVAKVADRVSRVNSRRSSIRSVRKIGIAFGAPSIASAAAATGWVLEGRIVHPAQTFASAARVPSVRARDSNGRTPVSSHSPREAAVREDREHSEAAARDDRENETHGITSAIPATNQHERQRGLLRSDSQAALKSHASTLLSCVADPAPAAAEAARLYAEANHARRTGNTARALELYRNLLTTWPHAKEAEQSRLAEGELLLQSGDADGALRAFRDSQASTTTAMSLWGAAGASNVLLPRTRLTGALQKGPFVLGSSVLLSPLNAQAIPNGALYSTQTTNNFGEFQLDLDVAGPVSIEGTGFYYNEVAGTLSLAPLTLRALFNVAENSARAGEMAGAAGQPEGGSAAQSAYVNLITHLAYFRVKTLALSGSVTLGEAIRKAEAEVRSELGIGPTALAPTTPATQMNLLGGDNLANAYSFAVGTVLAQAAARRTGPIDANLQELLTPSRQIWQRTACYRLRLSRSSRQPLQQLIPRP